MATEIVSVVMATYNGAKYLREQLDSILDQSYQSIELIVVDDASKDETLSILHEYSALDERVHVFPAEKNLGLVFNFERGIKLAKGNFIVLADQDDIFRRDKIERLLDALSKHPSCSVAISDLSLINLDGKEIATSMWRYQKLKPRRGLPFRQLLYSNFATGCAMMFRRRLIEIAIPFPPDCYVHDWWLAVVSASRKGGGICLVQEPLTAYRQHGENVMGARAVGRLTIKEIVTRIKAPSRGEAVIATRTNSLKNHIARLNGYLLKDCWTSNERLIIEQVKSLFEDYLTDAHSALLNRVIKIPQRVRYAATTGRLSQCIPVVIATLWPRK